jgi:heme/copper-type cytochrome/quinol oxidase subunit 4
VSRINSTVRGLIVIVVIAGVVTALQLEVTLVSLLLLARIAFFLAIAFFLFLLWRERRGDLEAWSDWNRKLFYASIVLAVLAIGLAIGYGLPGDRDAFALVVVVGACAYVLVRVWRAEHRY